MKTAMIIPARYASTRFPGKPLAMIGGQTMLARVVALARAAQKDLANVLVAVATEDERIAAHCKEIDIPCLMTSPDCATGSDRVLEAIEKTGKSFDHVVVLQGDAPFTPPQAPRAIVEVLRNTPSADIATPVVRLRWSELDALREMKKTTPFSGTTCVMDSSGRALWFSKNILPAIRSESRLRAEGEFSPVCQHIGLYGYTMAALKRFVETPSGHYEQLEGLEQLRLLEQGAWIQTVMLSVDAGLAQAGIDSPEDITRAERVLSTIER